MGFSGGKKRLGFLLCWAVVFADIGTSVYYTPGILYSEVRGLAATFVLMTAIAFVLLAAKYAEIAGRFREGGGVVAVAGEAFSPYIGALGGMLISVDYFLTTSISSVAGVTYFASVVSLGDLLLPVVVIALALLGLLNAVGIKESAGVTVIIAAAALLIDLAVLAVVATQLSAENWRAVGAALIEAKGLKPVQILSGFAGAWLAFSGLESISQIAPAMRSPRERTAGISMLLVVFAVLATSPLLTAFATVLPRVNKHASERLVSELALSYGGVGLKVAVVLTASVLLLFAANTAIIGCYHVFRALARQNFLPGFLARISPRFGTPHIAIAVAVFVPIAIVLLTHGDLILLGHMYAFGLLGAFSLSSVGLDVLRWRERRRGLLFVAGVLVSIVVVAAWVTNMVTKPLATAFGAFVTLVGAALAVSVRRGWFKPITVPLPYLSRTLAEAEAAEKPAAERILTLTEARDLQPIYKSQYLLCVRNTDSDRLLRKTAERLKMAGETILYALYVEEIPGLFFPAGIGPSPEANRVLGRTVSFLERYGLMALPLWRVGHSAGETISHTAQQLNLRNIIIGTSRRTPLWRLLRGSVLREINANVAEGTELSIVH